MFKYFEILRKSLSGTIGKNLLNLEFPLKSETEGGTQEFLLRLRDSRLKDDALLEQFYDRIIESYEYVGNYLILLIPTMCRDAPETVSRWRMLPMRSMTISLPASALWICPSRD
jgi:hypothetical protein